MLRLLSIALLPALIAGQEFQCGTDKIQADIAKTVVQFNCKDKVADINGCCIQHDGCYDRQEARGICDASFCTCVAAASAGNPLCGFYTTIFCDTAKVFGEAAYKKVGDERKTREKREEEERARTSTQATVPPTTPVPTTTVTVPTTTNPVPKEVADILARIVLDAKKAEAKTEKPALDVLAGFKSATKQEIKIVEKPKFGDNFTPLPVTDESERKAKTKSEPKPEPKFEPKKGGESRHKEEKLPGDKTKTLMKSETAPTTTVPEALEQTSSEEDREVADLEARLAREEAALEREEETQRRVLEVLATRKAALRADLQRFREAQRALWKAKKEEEEGTISKEGTVAASEDSTLTPPTTTVAVIEEPTTTTTVAPSTTADPSLDPLRKREEQRAKGRALLRKRHEEVAKHIAEHKARVLAARTLLIQATSTTTTTTTEEPAADEPKVTVTSELIEGSGQEEKAATKAAGVWSDDDLIPEAE